MMAASKEKNKDLPAQVVPVYPSTHAHCDDEHIVLASAAVHWVFDEHAIPTTAEKKRRKYHKNLSCKPTIRSDVRTPPPPLKNHKNIGFLSNTGPDL